MEDISADNSSAIEMDRSTVPAYQPVDSGYTVKRRTSDRISLKSAVTSKAANRQKEKESSTPGKKRSNSLIAKSNAGKSAKPTGSPAKKVAKPQAGRDKSPLKQAATTKDKLPRKLSKAKAQSAKTTATTKDKKPRKPSKEAVARKPNAKAVVKSSK